MGYYIILFCNCYNVSKKKLWVKTLLIINIANKRLSTLLKVLLTDRMQFLCLGCKGSNIVFIRVFREHEEIIMEQLEKNIHTITEELLKHGILTNDANIMGGTRKERAQLVVDTLARTDLDTYMCFVQALENLNLKKLVELFVDAPKKESFLCCFSKWVFIILCNI